MIAAVVLAVSAATFPGPERELPSPDGAFTISYFDRDASSGKYRLLLRAAPSPKSWEIHSFSTPVDVSWAPKDHLLAVTELGDRATTVVLGVRSEAPVDVCAGRAYRSCVQDGWTDAGDLVLHVSGDGFDTRVTVPRAKLAAPPK